MNSPLVVYPGRFQPPHYGHYKVYCWACDRFEKENVWIVTSDKTGKKSPYDFSTKKKLWKELFDVDRVFMCKNPAFEPIELISQFPHRPVLFIVSQKDRNRYQKYMKEYDENEILESTNMCRRFVVAPVFGDISATLVRSALQNHRYDLLAHWYGPGYPILLKLAEGA